MTQVGKINVNHELQEVKNTKTQAGKSYLLNQPIQDSVSFGNKEKEEGMSTSAKIALWATGIAAAAGAIYLAVRKGKTDEVADAAKDAAKNIKNRTDNTTPAVQKATEKGKSAVTNEPPNPLTPIDEIIQGNNGGYIPSENSFTIKGIYGQDINAPTDLRNQYDMMSPYYKYNNNGVFEF